MRQITLKNNQLEADIFRARVLVAAGFVLFCFSLLIARYSFLQVVEYDTYATLSENNRVRLEPLPPPRGFIYDRNGLLLADNQPSFSVTINRQALEEMAPMVTTLTALLNLSPEEIQRFWRKARVTRKSEEVPLRLNLTDEDIAKLSEERHRLPGVNIQVSLARHYPHGDLFAHSIGYVSRISEKEQEKLDPSVYAGTQLIGKQGIEKYYEGLLHGKPGFQHVEANAHGQVIRVLKRTPPQRGDDLTLHLDYMLQKIANEQLAGRRGAIVAIEPQTGGVLAFVSNPSFDPNPFVGGIPYALYKSLREHEDRPLFNRAALGIYPPGSTIKPFHGLAGLQLGLVDWDFRISDPGYYHLPGDSHRFRDWKKGGHGIVDLNKAVTQSCDTYFYTLGGRIGVDRFHDFFGQFGFGQKTGIDLDSEAFGTLPSKDWKRKRLKAPWYPGEMMSVAIGQGYFTATPLQLTMATAILANNGKHIRPHLLKSASGPKPFDPGNRPDGQIPLTDPTNWLKMHAAMTNVVHGPGGTAGGIGRNLTAYQIAGKTGTAQVRGIKQGEKYVESKVELRFRDHAWFIAFAPANDPKIAVTVLVENGAHGSTTAAPIARALFDYWMQGVVPPPPEPKPEETSEE